MTLYLYELLIGFKINFSKSYLVGLGLQYHEALGCATIMGCTFSSFPFYYLGIPLHYKTLLIKSQNFQVNKVEQRLAGKRNTLTVVERLTLVNSVLRAIPRYWMSVHQLPLTTIKKIDKSYRNFLWNWGRQSSNLRNLASWSSICHPKQLQGLGIVDL